MEMMNLQIQIFLLIAVGYWMSKRGMFNKTTRAQLTSIILNVILPCSVIKSFQIELSHDLIHSMMMILFISFGIQGLYMIFNKLLYRSWGKKQAACARYGTMVSNAGFMGMPIAESVFGPMGMLYASIFLIPQRIFMWSSGITLFTEGASKKQVIRQVITNPNIIAIFIGVIIMLYQTNGYPLPQPVTKTIASISSCCTAFSMFVIGGILSDVNPKSMLDNKAFFFSFIRLLVLPITILICVRLLHISVLPANVCVLLSAMPAASTTAMLAEVHDSDGLFASKLVFMSTLCSLFTLPIITLLF